MESGFNDLIRLYANNLQIINSLALAHPVKKFVPKLSKSVDKIFIEYRALCSA